MLINFKTSTRKIDSTRAVDVEVHTEEDPRMVVTMCAECLQIKLKSRSIARTLARQLGNMPLHEFLGSLVLTEVSPEVFSLGNLRIKEEDFI